MASTQGLEQCFQSRWDINSSDDWQSPLHIRHRLSSDALIRGLSFLVFSDNVDQV